MKKLSIICMVMFLVLSAGQVFALPGVYKAGASTMALSIGRCDNKNNTYGWNRLGYITFGVGRISYSHCLMKVRWLILLTASAMTGH